MSALSSVIDWQNSDQINRYVLKQQRLEALANIDKSKKKKKRTMRLSEYFGDL